MHDSCGFAKDALRKIVRCCALTECPSCGAIRVQVKQLTAAGFQLKGSGWYATDFKDGGKATASRRSSEDKSAAEAWRGLKAIGKTEAEKALEPRKPTLRQGSTQSPTAKATEPLRRKKRRRPPPQQVAAPDGPLKAEHTWALVECESTSSPACWSGCRWPSRSGCCPGAGRFAGQRRVRWRCWPARRWCCRTARMKRAHLIDRCARSRGWA